MGGLVDAEKNCRITDYGDSEIQVSENLRQWISMAEYIICFLTVNSFTLASEWRNFKNDKSIYQTDPATSYNLATIMYEKSLRRMYSKYIYAVITFWKESVVLMYYRIAPPAKKYFYLFIVFPLIYGNRLIYS